MMCKIFAGLHGEHNIPRKFIIEKLSVRKLIIISTVQQLLDYCSFIVNPDMVGKPGKLQSVYNELRFYAELASPCTNLLKLCLPLFQ